MDDAEIKANRLAQVERERNAPIQTWWLSFADEAEFLGVAIVRARGVFDAIRVCRELDCGTGGRGAVNAEPVPEGEIEEKWYNRLLDADEVGALNEELASGAGQTTGHQHLTAQGTFANAGAAQGRAASFGARDLGSAFENEARVGVLAVKVGEASCDA